MLVDHGTKMNGETTTKLKNSHLQNILTSMNTQEKSSIRMPLKKSCKTVRCNNQTNT